MDNENKNAEYGAKKDCADSQFIATNITQMIYIRLKMSQIFDNTYFLIAMGFVFLILTIAISASHINVIASASLITIFAIYLIIMAWRNTRKEWRYQERLQAFIDKN